MGATMSRYVSQQPSTTIVPKTAAAQAEKRSRRPHRRHYVAQPGSVYDIMHDNSALSLFVMPMCWTAVQGQLLGFRFKQMPSQTTPEPSSCNSQVPRTPRSPTPVAMARDLVTLVTPDTPCNLAAKNRAIRNVMSTMFPSHFLTPMSSADLDLRFGTKSYRRAVRCHVLWKHPVAPMSFDSVTTLASSGSTTSQLMPSTDCRATNDSPVSAYISRAHLDYIRRNCFRVAPGPNRSFNGPVHRLSTARSKFLIPSNPDEDQYFVAALIAMAQWSVFGNGSRNGAVTRDVKVRLITVSEEDESFIVYTATIPAALLMMLHKPHIAPQAKPHIEIEYTHVPVWPAVGLKERLAQVLGPGLIGDVDAHNIDHFDAVEGEETPAIESPKRKREVFAEVFNASFSEDQESFRDHVGLAKRRCLEEGRVGVVR